MSEKIHENIWKYNVCQFAPGKKRTKRHECRPANTTLLKKLSFSGQSLSLSLSLLSGVTVRWPIYIISRSRHSLWNAWKQWQPVPSPNSLATQRFALSASNATGASACPESLSRSGAGKGAHVKPPASDLEFGLAGATCNDEQGCTW